MHVEKNEIVNLDWYPLWHIIMYPQCILEDKGPKFPWLHSEKEGIVVEEMLHTLKT